MNFKHYCPDCKQQRELTTIGEHIKAMWKYHFDEDYDFYKSQQQIEMQNKWLIEKLECFSKMQQLIEKSEELKKELYKYKEYKEFIIIQRDLGLLKQHYEYREKETKIL